MSWSVGGPRTARARRPRVGGPRPAPRRSTSSGDAVTPLIRRRSSAAASRTAASWCRFRCARSSARPVKHSARPAKSPSSHRSRIASRNSVAQRSCSPCADAMTARFLKVDAVHRRSPDRAQLGERPLVDDGGAVPVAAAPGDVGEGGLRVRDRGSLAQLLPDGERLLAQLRRAVQVPLVLQRHREVPQGGGLPAPAAERRPAGRVPRGRAARAASCRPRREAIAQATSRTLDDHEVVAVAGRRCAPASSRHRSAASSAPSSRWAQASAMRARAEPPLVAQLAEELDRLLARARGPAGPHRGWPRGRPSR